MEPHLQLGWHLRQRILPALARIDGLEGELPRVAQVVRGLVGGDLDFDLRQGPRHPSNLCEAQASLELAYTFGGREQCGLRYSTEPLAPRGVLRNRYTVFRDRLLRLMRELAPGYDVALLQRLFFVGVPRRAAADTDTTITIAAVHHYRDRPPRLKAYFSCDWDNPGRARASAQALIGQAGSDELEAQARTFHRFYSPQGGVRMVGFDFEPGRAVEVKLYKTGEGLRPRSLARLIEEAGGGSEAQQGVQVFRDVFLDGATDPALFDLVSRALRRGGGPGLKLYIRPADLYDDAEALRRLRNWYGYLGKTEELAMVERGLATVAPLEVIGATRGFFNYFSVDVGHHGVSKTSVYYTPQIPLMHLARHDAGRLQELAAEV
ncbi:MAG: hypothetical protein ABIJ09_26650 [Pseudomonadota bacterium]